MKKNHSIIFLGIATIVCFVLINNISAQGSSAILVSRSDSYVNTCGDKSSFSSDQYWTIGLINKNVSVNVTGVISNLSAQFKILNSGSDNNSQLTTGDPNCKETEKLRASVVFYGFPSFTFNMSSKVCVTNTKSKSFQISTVRNCKLFTDNLVKNLRLQVSKGKGFSEVRTLTLSTTTNGNSFSYEDFAGAYREAWYGEDLYFRLVVTLTNNQNLNGPVSSPVIFYKSIPSPTLKSADRSACNTESITLTIDPSIANHISKYSFRARVKEYDEKLSTIIYLKLSSLHSNDVKLEVDTAHVREFDNTKKTYIFQVFNSDLDGVVSLKDYECVTPWEGEIIAKPELPNQIISAPVRETVGTTEYHLTKHNASDGAISTTIHNYPNVDGDLKLYYQKSGEKMDSASISGSPNGVGYEWILPNIAAGKYGVKLVDADGCSSMSTADTLVLNAPDSVKVNSIQNSQLVNCHPENGSNDTVANKQNGEISLSWAGGIPPYTIDYGGSSSINTTTTSTLINNLSTGLRTVRISDKYSVLATDTVTVASNKKLYFTHTFDTANCFGEVTDLTITAINDFGRNNFQLFDLNNNLLDAKPSPDSAIKYNFNDLTANQYLVNVTSQNCFITDTIKVETPTDIGIRATGSKIAEYGGSDGKIALHLTGGTGDFIYTMYDSLGALVDSSSIQDSVVIENLSDNYYDFHVSDASLCKKAVQRIRVRQPDAALRLTFTKLNVDCKGNSTGKVFPTATGGWGQYLYGYNGAVYGSVSEINGLEATTAPDSVFVIDSAQVVVKRPISITEPEELVSTIDSVYRLKCFEDNTGRVKLNITGGTYPYRLATDTTNWLPGDSLSHLAASSGLALYVRDSNNCQSELQTIITQPEALSISTDTIIDAFCLKHNGGIHAQAFGGTIKEKYYYEWYYLDSTKTIPNNSPMLDNVYSGRYRLTITDDNSCVLDTLFVVSDQDGPKINAYTVDSVSCYQGSDGTITLTDISDGMPGYNYFVNGKETDTIIEGLPFGDHLIRVLDKKGCKVDASVRINQPDSLQIHASITPPICHDAFNGSIVAVPIGGNGQYHYKWNTGDTLFALDSLNAGAFNLVLRDRKNCTAKASYEVIPPLMPKPEWEKKDALICTGNYVTLDGGDFVSWVWKDEKNTVLSTERFTNANKLGAYILELTDSDGCVGLDTFMLKVSDTPLDSKIMLPDSAHINESIGVLDVTWPVPDSVEWLYSKQVSVIDSNSWSQHFSANEEGVIEVTLRAWYDGCYSDSSKTVTIYYEEGFKEQDLKMGGALISGLRTYPNPNNGDFRVGVALSEIADISISLYASSHASLIDKQTFYGLDRYEIPYNLSGLKPGIYMIVLQAGQEQRIMKVIVK